MIPERKTVLYARVSTSEQTGDHQLEQALAAGFEITKTITDHGVSGVTVPLADRDQGKRLFDLLQAGDTLVVRWIDRLGRNYDDVKKSIETFNAMGVTVRTVINGMTFQSDLDLEGDDTGKAVRNALLGFMAAMASADAKAKKEAREAGIKHALASPDKDRKYRGKRPSYDRAGLEIIQSLLTQDSTTIAGIAREVGVSRQTVMRIRSDPAEANRILLRWNM